jgi:methanethiol S-methyltransferase
MSRLIALIYGLLSYSLFVVTFLYAAGFVGGFAVPRRLTAAKYCLWRTPSQTIFACCRCLPSSTA